MDLGLQSLCNNTTYNTNKDINCKLFVKHYLLNTYHYIIREKHNH